MRLEHGEIEGPCRQHSFTKNTYGKNSGIHNPRHANSPSFSLFLKFLAVHPTNSLLQLSFIMHIYNILKNSFILIVCCKALVVEATACYWPNGSETQPVDSMQACNSTVNGADSACCVSEDVCTNRGLCISLSHGYMYRGACTNQAWRSDACFQECLQGGIAPRSLV